MSGQTFAAGVPPTGAQLTNIVYQNDDGVSNAAVTSGSDTTTSSSYANMAGTGSVTSYSFTKALTSTRLKVTIAASYVALTNNATVQVGVLVSGTDYDCGRVLITTGAGGYSMGWAYITGLAAGTYTIQARWKRTSGTGTASRGTDQWLSIACAEVT